MPKQTLEEKIADLQDYRRYLVSEIDRLYKRADELAKEIKSLSFLSIGMIPDQELVSTQELYDFLKERRSGNFAYDSAFLPRYEPGKTLKLVSYDVERQQGRIEAEDRCSTGGIPLHIIKGMVVSDGR